MNCDPLARWYRWMEYAGMGYALKRRRDEFLAEMADASRVLILGEGDGRFLSALLRVNHRAEIDVVDNSARMLAAAERRVRAFSGNRVRYHQADACTWTPLAEARYDLIVTHFFLDCFTEGELAPMVERFAMATAERCRWIVSEFHQPRRGLAAWRAHLWIGALYRLFGWTTGLRVRRLPGYGPLLERQDFRRTRSVVAEWGLLTSELWERRGSF